MKSKINQYNFPLMENLPNDVIYEICIQMDDQELSTFVQTSGLNYQICNDILQKRKEQFFTEKVNEIIFKVKRDSPDNIFGRIRIRISSDPNKAFILTQDHKDNYYYLVSDKFSKSRLLTIGIVYQECVVRNILLQLFMNGHLTSNYILSSESRLNGFI